MGKQNGALETMVLNTNFWRNKSVFLTGHTGFKGAWLALYLLHLGAKVTGFALAPQTPPKTTALFDVLGLGAHLHSIIGDIRNADLLTNSLKQTMPDIVLHLAAQPLVRLSYAAPLETYSTNVIGLVNLFEAARQMPSVRAILNVTTDKCYQNREINWAYLETDALGGYDPYSASKACAELISASYRQSFFAQNDVGLATARAGNVIGGGDWSTDRLIPDIIQAWQNRQVLSIRSPQAIRPWQHVFEPLRGYLMLVEKLWQNPAQFAQAWNFGPSIEGIQTVQTITKTAQNYFDNELEVQYSNDKNQLHEATLLQLNSSKAHDRLGWHTCLSFEETLYTTFAWYAQAQRLSAADLAQFSQQQLTEYFKKL